MQCQSMAHGTLCPVGRHGIDVPDAAQRFFEDRQSFRLNAVIIGEQNNHDDDIVAKMRLPNKVGVYRWTRRLVSLTTAKV